MAAGRENDAQPPGFDEEADKVALDQKSHPNSSVQHASKLTAPSASSDARHAERFMRLFTGYDRAFGIYNGITEQREDGKKLGTQRETKRGAVTVDLWRKHLAGTSGLGIIPICADSTVVWGAIDIDVYAELDHKELATRFERLRLPLIVCRSKSGGAHIFSFASEPIPAALMVGKLRELAAILGHGNAEIFPKQTVIDPDRGDAGSWLNMAYFNGMLGGRHAVRADGDAMDAGEFLDAAEKVRQSREWFKERTITPSSELPQAPPCLQHLVQIGFGEGSRNNGLFNLGVYCRKVDSGNWEAMLDEMNQNYMKPQLPPEEVMRLKKSLRGKTYTYKCHDQPIAAYCNRAVCRTRKYGIGGAAIDLEFGGLTKVNTDPVTWFWEVMGKRVELSTDDLQDPYKFQRKCMDALTAMPAIPKREEWQEIISKAMETAVELEPPEDSTVRGRLSEMVRQFCTGRAQAMSRNEISLGKPFDDGKHTWFRLEDLIAFLERKRFNEVPRGKLSIRLKDIGAEDGGRERLNGVRTSLWRVLSFDKQTVGHAVPPCITGEERPF